MPQKRHLRWLPLRGSCHQTPVLESLHHIHKQRAAVLELALRLSTDYGLPEDSVNVQYVRVVRKHASQVVRGNVEVFQRQPWPARYHCPEQLCQPENVEVWLHVFKAR